MMENLEIISIPAIVAIVCTVMQMLKKAFANEKFNCFIPILAVLLGAAIGLAAFYLYPNIMPTDDALTALFIGGASGWAATGAYETGKGMLREE